VKRKLWTCHLSREAQLFVVGWVSALRNPCGRWVSCFNPTYVHLIFNSTHPVNTISLKTKIWSLVTDQWSLGNWITWSLIKLSLGQRLIPPVFPVDPWRYRIESHLRCRHLKCDRGKNSDLSDNRWDDYPYSYRCEFFPNRRTGSHLRASHGTDRFLLFL
jgi:hypothetical protein